jgi:hypothetical protein
MLAAITLSAAALIGGYASRANGRRLMAATINERILPHLSPGASRRVVEAYLAADPLQLGSRWKYGGYSAREGSVESHIIGASAGLLVRTDLEIKCFFDQRGRLAKTRVRELYVGP